MIVGVPLRQHNVNLDPDLIRAVKHHAVDAQLSLSELVRRVLEHHLSREAAVTAPRTAAAGIAPSLTLQPMVHVAQLSPAVSFYEWAGASCTAAGTATS